MTMGRLLKGLFTAALVLMTAHPGWAGGTSAVSAYSKGDFETAFRLFSEQAGEGALWAQFYLGMMHVKGEGVESDNVVALQWFYCVAETETEMDGDVAREAKEWRAALAATLSPSARHKAHAMAETTCGIPAKERASKTLYSPHRDGFLELIFFFFGDLTVVGLLAIANVFDLSGLQNAVLSLFRSYGNGFVTPIAVVVWLVVLWMFFKVWNMFEGIRIGKARPFSEKGFHGIQSFWKKKHEDSALSPDQ